MALTTIVGILLIVKPKLLVDHVYLIVVWVEILVEVVVEVEVEGVGLQDVLLARLIRAIHLK
jgi:hypothetical protein